MESGKANSFKSPAEAKHESWLRPLLTPLDTARRYLPPAICWAFPTRHVSRISNVNGYIFSKTVKRTIVPLGRSNPRAIAIPIASCGTGTTFYASSPRSNSQGPRMIPTVLSKETTASDLFRRLNPYSKQHGLYQALKAFGQILKSHFILRVIFPPAKTHADLILCTADGCA
jgi:hypothetical protein